MRPGPDALWVCFQLLMALCACRPLVGVSSFNARPSLPPSLQVQGDDERVQDDRLHSVLPGGVLDQLRQRRDRDRRGLRRHVDLLRGVQVQERRRVLHGHRRNQPMSDERSGRGKTNCACMRDHHHAAISSLWTICFCHSSQVATPPRASSSRPACPAVLSRPPVSRRASAATASAPRASAADSPTSRTAARSRPTRADRPACIMERARIVSRTTAATRRQHGAAPSAGSHLMCALCAFFVVSPALTTPNPVIADGSVELPAAAAAALPAGAKGMTTSQFFRCMC